MAIRQIGNINDPQGTLQAPSAPSVSPRDFVRGKRDEVVAAGPLKQLAPRAPEPQAIPQGEKLDRPPTFGEQVRGGFEKERTIAEGKTRETSERFTEGFEEGKEALRSVDERLDEDRPKSLIPGPLDLARKALPISMGIEKSLEPLFEPLVEPMIDLARDFGNISPKGRDAAIKFVANEYNSLDDTQKDTIGKNTTKCRGWRCCS